MSTLIKKIEINDRELSMTYVDNQWWIAVKPICEALGVDHTAQFQNIKSDEILGPAYANQHMQVGGQMREMICLPERYIYGWIFSIRSKSSALVKYKQICYNVLYDHFHGVLAQRAKVLKTKTLKEIEAEQLKKEFEGLESYKKYKQLKSEISNDNKCLEQLDTKYVATQLELWSSE